MIRAKLLVAKFLVARLGPLAQPGGHLVSPQFIAIGDEAIVGQDSVITAHNHYQRHAGA